MMSFEQDIESEKQQSKNVPGIKRNFKNRKLLLTCQESKLNERSTNTVV